MRLTLYLPTYRRPHFFHRLLESIHPQLDPEVRVVAAVNPPADGYEFPEWVEVITRRVNVGGNVNCALGPVEARTPYVWMLGDDEQLAPGAIAHVLDLLDDSPGSVVQWDGRFNVPHRGQGFSTLANYFGSHSRLASAISLMSSTVWATELYDTETALRYMDTGYGWYFGLLHANLMEPVRVVSQPTFIAGHHSNASIWSEPPEAQAQHKSLYPGVWTVLADFIFERSGVRLHPRELDEAGFDS